MFLAKQGGSIIVMWRFKKRWLDAQNIRAHLIWVCWTSAILFANDAQKHIALGLMHTMFSYDHLYDAFVCC
jgi:hypothetical protein